MAEPTRRSADCPDPVFSADAAAQLRHVRRASFALTRNYADAEDLVQDAYVRALSASARFERGTNLKAWLLTILRNLTRNHRRDRSRSHLQVVADVQSVLDAAHAPPAASPDHALLGASIDPVLQTALESMPKILRDAVWLRDVEELSYAEIAVRLRIPPGTVMSRISRGRRLLHARLTGSNL